MKEHILNKIISEAIERLIHRNVLLEMAFDRANYKQKVDALIEQLIQYWCLVKYCTISRENNINRNHWACELQGILATISRYNINGNNSPASRMKALREVWNDNDFDTQTQCVDLAVYNKFNEEKIDITSPAYQATLQCCIDACNEIISVIVQKSRAAIDTYVKTL
jgi:hypothetical protein